MIQPHTMPESVWLNEDYDKIPEGSCIHVTSETDLEYQGTCSFMGATYSVNVQKSVHKQANLK